MANKAQQRKEQKKSQRKKRLDKERNERASKARFRYRLDVKVGDKWRAAKRFRTSEEVQSHLDETEAIRKRGDTEIIEGRVLDMNSTFQTKVATVKAFCPTLHGPSMIEAAKDVFEAAGKINEETFEKGLGN